LDTKKTTAFLQANAPLLKNLLTIYLASQTIEDMRGDRNLRRIQLEMLDNFNEKLFPGGAPQIKQVLFKEFAVQ
jgi:flagellar basal body-associated protein FliL